MSNANERKLKVPLYGLLLFGGNITINHWAGGIMLGTDGRVKIRANTRIGVLCSQLRYVIHFTLFTVSKHLLEILTCTVQQTAS